MFAKYDKNLVSQAKKNRKKFEQLKSQFKEWKIKPVTEYEKYKKEDQPVIDKLDAIGKDVIDAIEKNREIEKQLLPYDGHFDDMFPIPPTPKETSFERSLFVDDPITPNTRKRLEPMLEQIEDEERGKIKSLTDYSTTLLGPKVSKYLGALNDTTFGLRFAEGRHYMGDSPVTFNGEIITVNGREFKASDGLMKLLTSKNVSPEDYTSGDLDAYTTMLKVTNAIFQNNDPKGTKPKSSSSEKYNSIIKPIWQSYKKERSNSTDSKNGMGFVKRYTAKPVEYVWMNDVRDLIDRLMVIHGEENAGNNNFHNEKVGITKMLMSKFNDFIVNNPKGIPYLIRFLNNLPHTFWKSESHGKGLVNTLINNLPIEMHLPGYNYCGPGTKLEERLERGDAGINPLDEACKRHDIAYRDHKDLEQRHQADKELQKAVKDRMFSKDASLGERLASTAVAGIMFGKRKLGLGLDDNGWTL